MDCRVVVEAAVPVYDVGTPDEAVRIAISKTGDMLNPDLSYVEINMGERSCPECGHVSDPAFIAADEGLVALELEMTVFNVEREEHASRIARKEIGQRLDDIPLSILEVEVLPDEEEGEVDADVDEAEVAADEEVPTEVADDAGADEDAADDRGSGEDGSSDRESDVLPDFDDLIE